MFELPPLAPGIDPTLPTDKKQLAEWLKEGEGRDISATIRRVYDTLKGLNRASLSNKNRFAMLELLVQPLANIADTLERHYAGLDQPLPPPNRKIAQSLGRLLRQYNFGYQRIVAATMEQSGRFDQASIYATSHARVLKICADSLMVYYRAYLAPPEGIWRDMHQTYQQAKSLSIHQRPLANDPQKSSPEQLYLTALLCDLADPYRLIAGDVDQACNYVREHLQLCRIDSPGREQKKVGQFAVHFGIDAGAHEVADSMLKDERSGFLLDTTKLVKQIHQRLTDMGLKATPAEQWHQQKKHIVMLRCLVVAFALRPNRQQERSAADGQLWVVRGIKAVHSHILAGAVDANSIPEIQLDDSGSQPVVPMPPAGDQMHHWDMLDESPGGYALLREATGHARVAIGDLLAISDSPDGPWQSGVVKRVRYRGEEDLIVGVQKLSGEAQAVWVAADGDQDGRLPGLLHRGQGTGGFTTSLLLPPGQWVPGQSITVEKIGNLKLDRVQELTGQFELFEVSAG